MPPEDRGLQASAPAIKQGHKKYATESRCWQNGDFQRRQGEKSCLSSDIRLHARPATSMALGSALTAWELALAAVDWISPQIWPPSSIRIFP